MKITCSRSKTFGLWANTYKCSFNVKDQFKTEGCVQPKDTDINKRAINLYQAHKGTKTEGDMNYERLTTGLLKGSYANDPEEKFWHCLL